MRQNTKKKWENFWFYHKIHILLGAAAVFVVCYFVFADGLTEKPDYSVLYVGTQEPDQAVCSAAEECLAALGTDLNGDGKVVVSLHRCIVDLAATDQGTSENPQRDQANLAALEGDIGLCQSGIVLTDEPLALQNHSTLMQYLDGSCPAEGADDVAQMFYEFDEIFGELPGDAKLYIGMRRWWTKEQEQELSEDLALWEKVKDCTAKQDRQ